MRRGVVVAVLALAGCGGGGGDSRPPEPPAPSRKAASPAAGAATGEVVVVDGWTVLGENPKWKPIQPLFDAYVKREITGLHNPARNNLHQFVEKPIVEEPLGTAEATPQPTEHPEAKVDTPETRFALGSLSLVLLVTGVAQPKALIIGPDGSQFAVVRGQHLGSEGGVVSAITQYELRISVPGAPDVVRSLAPPLNPVEELDAETQGAGKKPEL